MKGASRFSHTNRSLLFSRSAATNCGECGKEPVTNGRPKHGPIKLKTDMQKKEEWK
jgi:hypothetical protein